MGTAARLRPWTGGRRAAVRRPVPAVAAVAVGLLVGGCAATVVPGPPVPEPAPAPAPSRRAPAVAVTGLRAPRSTAASAGPPLAVRSPPRPTVRTAPHGGRRPTQGTGSWRSRHLDPTVIEAYSTRAGGGPGTPVGLRVSTGRRHVRVLAYRIGAYRGGTGHLVWRSPRLVGRTQPGPTFAPYRTRTVVAPWRTGLRIATAGWRPGFYVLKVVTSGASAQVPYVVTSPRTAGTVALSVPVATWQAYNLWGHYSLYRGPPGDHEAFAVDFDRPYWGVGGFNDFRTTVVPVVVAAERTGVPLSYLPDVALDRRPGLLRGAQAFVSVAHAEYWTPRMRAAVLRARDRGTNLAFLGSNTAYWRIRLHARGGRPGRLETGYRGYAWMDPDRSAHPEVATARFRDPPDPRPENQLTGMLYECYPATTDYRIVTPRWWGFAGTGVHRGSVVAALVGDEADRVYPDHRTPRPLQVLSSSGYGCDGVATSSQAVYYTTPSGAGVFTAGTLRWGCALVDRCDVPLAPATRRFVRIVTRNLFRGMAVGPVGAVHPARDNVDHFALPLLNTVPAS